MLTLYTTSFLEICLQAITDTPTPGSMLCLAYLHGHICTVSILANSHACTSLGTSNCLRFFFCHE